MLSHSLSKRQLLPQTLPNLLIIHIKREHVTKLLSVFIDESLSWKQQIDIVSTKISKSVGILYKSRDVLIVFQLNIFNILCIMYKCKQDLNPHVFRNIFTRRTKTKYALRNENSIQEPPCRTNFSQCCFSYRGPYLWNKLVISKNLTFSVVIPTKRLNVNLNNFFYR